MENLDIDIIASLVCPLKCEFCKNNKAVCIHFKGISNNKIKCSYDIYKDFLKKQKKLPF